MEQMMRSMDNLPPETRQMFQQYFGFLLGGGTVVAVIFQIIFYPLSFFIGAGITHLFGLIFGVAKNGFNATARVVGYSMAPYALAWIPVCGGFVAPIYSLVLLIMGLAKAHETTTGRAAAAILVPTLVLCCCCAIGAGLLIATAAGAAGAK
jgi:hypothetical protein